MVGFGTGIIEKSIDKNSVAKIDYPEWVGCGTGNNYLEDVIISDFKERVEDNRYRHLFVHTAFEEYVPNCYLEINRYAYGYVEYVLYELQQ